MPKSPQEVIAELAALRQRVARQYPSPAADNPLPLVDLLPLFHARDAASGKVAAIGKVNPRPPGAWNFLIQSAKSRVARALGWFVRDQVDFNDATVRALTETLEAFNAINRSLVAAGHRIQALEQADPLLHVRPELRQATDNLSAQTRSVATDLAADLAAAEARLQHQAQQLAIQFTSLESKAESMEDAHHQHQDRLSSLAASLSTLHAETAQQAQRQQREEIRVLRTLADVQNAFMQRIALAETELRTSLQQTAADASQRSLAAAQSDAAARDALAAGLSRLEAQVHEEVRLLRQRVGVILARESAAVSSPASSADPILQAAAAIAPPEGFFDSLRFSERFRGGETEVREKLRVHLPHFLHQAPVLDLGCGRGEFVSLLLEAGVDALGIEASPDLVRLMQNVRLPVVEADLFAHLDAQPPASAGGIFCAHVIEHMPPDALARLVAAAYRVLRPGGFLLFETPNPACLAIFATYFYLDPTHVRPVPAEFVSYLLEEAGFQQVEVTGLHPAQDAFPSLKPLPDNFRQQFFGNLDYAISARKP